MFAGIVQFWSLVIIRECWLTTSVLDDTRTLDTFTERWTLKKLWISNSFRQISIKFCFSIADNCGSSIFHFYFSFTATLDGINIICFVSHLLFKDFRLIFMMKQWTLVGFLSTDGRAIAAEHLCESSFCGGWCSGVLMLVSMSLTVHFIEASQYWAEAGGAGQARKVVTANQNTISELCHCTPHNYQQEPGNSGNTAAEQRWYC